MNINSQKLEELRYIMNEEVNKSSHESNSERYLAFISQTTEGIWRFELDQPLPIFLSLEEQIEWFYTNAYLAECNDVMARMYGFNNSSEVIGMRLSEFLPLHSQANNECLSAFIRSGYKLSGVESEEIDRDGQTLYFSNSLTGIIVDGFLVRAWGIQTDVTDRRSAERALIEARKIAEAANEAKSRFLANMSHEIRTPLGAILGFIDLLLDPELSQEDKEHFSQIIRRNGEELLKLVDDILDLSKVEAGQLNFDFTNINLREFTGDLVSSLALKAKSKNITLSYEVLEGCSEEITTDFSRLRQVLINIIGNAIKFTEKGTVHLTVSYTNEDRKIHFLVRDSGIGIKSEDVVRLFKPFSQADSSMTRKFGGTGLGLSLSKKLAEVLGGSVKLIESTPGVGTLFEVIVEDQSRSHNEMPKLTKSTDVRNKFEILQSLSVLVVEDSIDNQTLIKKILEYRGVKVDLAMNGYEGVQKCLSTSYDLVLMDMQMPVLDGYKATKLLREKGYKLPIIALTADAMEHDRERCLMHGCTSFVPKPINIGNLIEAINKAVSS